MHMVKPIRKYVTTTTRTPYVYSINPPAGREGKKSVRIISRQSGWGACLYSGRCLYYGWVVGGIKQQGSVER